MSGICGIVNDLATRPVDGDAIKHMLQRMRHRGPDGEGELTLGNVGLGHVALSLTPPEVVREPIANENKTIWLVSDARIYNHKTLRENLESLGHRYATDADSESIVHLYEQYGEDCMRQLRGNYAFALWDTGEGKLILARDGLGTKPIYYAELKGGIIFASEIKALLAANWIRAELNRHALPEFFVFGYHCGEETLFKDVFKVPPGCYMIRQGGNRVMRKHWDVSYPTRYEEKDEAEIRERFQDLMRDILKTLLPARGNYGAFVSGGLDSSIVAALLTKHSGGRIKTFSIGYEEDEYSELRYARQVAEQIGSDHHEMVLSGEKFFELVPQVIWQEDKPPRYASSVSGFAACREAGKSIRIVFTGEGGDELFAGYGKYWATLKNMAWVPVTRILMPGPIREKVLRPLLWRLPISKKFKSLLWHSPLCRRSSLDDLFLDNFCTAMGRDAYPRLLSEELRRELSRIDPYQPNMAYLTSVISPDLLSKLQYLDIKSELVELLLRQDCIAMAASMETRAPFLDLKVVELSSCLPMRFKLSGRTGKMIERTTFGDLLPQVVLNREKMGFPTPVKKWISGAFHSQVVETIMERRALDRGYFDKTEIKKMLAEHRSGARDWTDALWLLYTFELWQRQFIDTR